MARERLVIVASGAVGDVMAGHTHTSFGTAFWPLALMWFAMMAAMMAPTAWPWILAFHRFGGAAPARRVGSTSQFGAGYLLAWLTYAIGAAVLQVTLVRAMLMTPSGDAVVPPVGAAIFLVAGLYQFVALKRACLTHCRTPLGYFLTRWVDGPIGAFRMGLHHGLFCVGCCWALMATAFAVGVMNVAWMAALGALALAEQIAPHGQILRRALGAAFVAIGLWRLAATA